MINSFNNLGLSGNKLFEAYEIDSFSVGVQVLLAKLKTPTAEHFPSKHNATAFQLIWVTRR